MNVKEKAKIFAINAHKGQVRKSEPEKAYGYSSYWGRKTFRGIWM